MKKLIKKIRKSPINYFSDLFIVAMVLLWVCDSVYESIIASMVTFSSIILSFQQGENCFEVSMWSSIGANIAIPLGAGGALWMIKNAILHKVNAEKGKVCEADFPPVEADGEEIIDDNTGKEEEETP